MGIAERRTRHKEDIKASILKVAWSIVEKDGWQSLSIRKIADAIEYSIPVIYDHFQNKEAILYEFTVRGFTKLNDELRRAKSQFANPGRQLEAMAYAYWRFAFDNKEYYQLMYGLGMPSCETVQKIPELATLSDLILSSINDLISLGDAKEVDPYLKLHTFWSMLHGLISINMMGAQDTREEMNLMVLKDFIAGFISGVKG
jgi:AcrR family transcriptional regulator